MRKMLGRHEQMTNFFFWNLGHDCMMLFRQQQDMTWSGRINFKNRKTMIIFVDFFGRYMAKYNRAKNAVPFLELFQLFRRHPFDFLFKHLPFFFRILFFWHRTRINLFFIKVSLLQQREIIIYLLLAACRSTSRFLETAVLLELA